MTKESNVIEISEKPMSKRISRNDKEMKEKKERRIKREII